MNELKFPLAEVKSIIQKWLFLEDPEIVDVMLAVHIANQLRTDPLWLLFITPPSNGKTELLRSFQGHPKAFFLSSLTPATLVSGHSTKANRNPSLLPKLSGRTLILKDFTTILSMRSENQQEILSQLREIYDGFYTKSFGTGFTFEWEGHVGLLGACTPAFDRHYAVLGALGDRFLLYRTDSGDGENMSCRASHGLGDEDVMRQEVKEAVHKFVSQFDNLGEQEIHFEKDPATEDKIIALACFTAIARCPVERERYQQTLLYNPLPEGPARLTKQLLQLAGGIALVNGQNRIDEKVYRPVKHVGRDLVSSQRKELLSHLWKEKVFSHRRQWKTTKEISAAVDKPTGTTKLLLEDLMIIKLVNRSQEGNEETAPYRWQLNDRAFDLLSRSEVYETRDLNKQYTEHENIIPLLNKQYT